jgi:hypothetical protein
MAKKEPPQPLFPLKHRFTDSLDNYIHVAGMLAEAVNTALSMAEDQPDLMKPALRQALKDRLDAFNTAAGRG